MMHVRLPKPVRTGMLAAGLPDENAYLRMDQRADETIRALAQPFPRTCRAYHLLLEDPRMVAHWEMSNYLTVGKLKYNDHGPIHARVTGAYAMQLMRYLLDARTPFDVIESAAGDADDACLVALVGVMMHDIGNSLHRTGHEGLSVVLAQPLLQEWLPGIYEDPVQRTLIQNFILSAIQCHDIHPPPLYMEGAVVAVADGCDMTKGRARMPIDLGKLDIHSVSALAIEDVVIQPLPGDVPVEIEVHTSNSAGIFQVEETLVRKLNATPLKNYVSVSITALDPHSATEKRIFTNATTVDGQLRAI
jgi:metal-dependent HD superfamily phosphatase/phosphodiesterase